MIGSFFMQKIDITTKAKIKYHNRIPLINITNLNLEKYEGVEGFSFGNKKTGP